MAIRDFGFALMLAAAWAPLYAQTDAKGSSDPALFPNRMPGYDISSFEQTEFASYSFATRPRTEVEGKHTRINYGISKGVTHPGALAILRNYENAIKAAGGKVLHSDGKFLVMKGMREGVEVWAEVRASAGRYYFMNIIERGAMKQVIKADAMSEALDKAGFVALDIHFATGKAEILAESRPLVAEIAAMLARRPALRVGVEGHTDNTGTPAGNRTLSMARAKAVAEALSGAGIESSRLVAAGFGQDKPVADNATEEGRAKNRRVEIVKK